jgi:hypothetical protein
MRASSFRGCRSRRYRSPRFADETPSIVYLETPDAGEITKDPATVGKITVTYDLLRAGALSASASRELIANVAEKRWN